MLLLTFIPNKVLHPKLLTDFKKCPLIKYCQPFIIGILFTSCATLLNQKTMNVNVDANTDSVKVCLYHDTTQWYDTPIRLEVERSRNDLLLLAKKDSIQKLVQVNSRLSTAFWLGNIWSGVGVVGYAIDMTNPKRFSYPSTITIDFDANKYYSNDFFTLRKPEKGLLCMKVSIPEGNHFYIDHGNGYGDNFGFLGISGELEYYITDKYSVSSTMGALTDFMIPFPAPVDYWGPHESASAIYGNIQLGSDLNRFNYGGGLQFNRTFYSQWDTIPRTSENYRTDTLIMRKIQNNIGLEFSTYYRISNGFNIGISYYPSVISWDKNGLKGHYSHLLFFELVFNVDVFRPGKK